MRIGEVAEKTGLSISNIRFYERKGLIKPDRNVESKYRDYTIQDVERLKRIILFRKMDFSIESISMIINDEVLLEDIIREHIDELKEKKEMLEGSIGLCERVMLDENEGMDIDYYLGYVKQEEKQGRLFAKLDELYDDFTEFSRAVVFSENQMAGSIIPDKWKNRISMLVWGVLCVGLPVFELIDSYGEEKFSRSLIVWGVWFIWWSIAFLIYRKEKTADRDSYHD